MINIESNKVERFSAATTATEGYVSLNLKAHETTYED
jgi:hypothetical protein